MLRVASIGAFVADNWFGPPLDRDAIVKVSLVHDVGNDFKLQWTPAPGDFETGSSSASPDAPASDPEGTPFLAAVKEQLGLKRALRCNIAQP